MTGGTEIAGEKLAKVRQIIDTCVMARTGVALVYPGCVGQQGEKRSELARATDVDQNLQAALSTFGRRERQLSAANVAHHGQLLDALFSEAELRDPDRKRALAIRVENAIREVIGAYADTPQKRAAEVVFAADPQMYGLDVQERLAVVETSDRAFTPSQYSRLRKKVIEHMVAALPYALSLVEGDEGDEDDGPLSSRARRYARQLYRYAQQPLVLIEAYNDCVRFEHELASRFDLARALVDVAKTSYGWWAKYGNPGEDYRFVPLSHTPKTDEAIWRLAYCERYRKALLSEPTGRAHLRENLPANVWVAIQYPLVFPEDYVDVLGSALGSLEIDSSSNFSAELESSDMGRGLKEGWLKFLACRWAQVERQEMRERYPIRTDKEGLALKLLYLCVLLQDLFPEDTLGDREYRFNQALWDCVEWGVLETIQSFDVEDLDQVEDVATGIFDRRPDRYREPTDDPVAWENELPEHNLWAR